MKSGHFNTHKIKIDPSISNKRFFVKKAFKIKKDVFFTKIEKNRPVFSKKRHFYEKQSISTVFPIKQSMRTSFFLKKDEFDRK